MLRCQNSNGIYAGKIEIIRIIPGKNLEMPAKLAFKPAYYANFIGIIRHTNSKYGKNNITDSVWVIKRSINSSTRVQGQGILLL